MSHQSLDFNGLIGHLNGLNIYDRSQFMFRDFFLSVSDFITDVYHR